MSPSTLEGPDKGRERRLAAKVRAAAKEGGSARRPLCRGSGTGPASGKQSDKLSGLGAPAPTNVKAEHDKPTAAPARKFWICPGLGTFSDTQT